MRMFNAKQKHCEMKFLNLRRSWIISKINNSVFFITLHRNRQISEEKVSLTTGMNINTKMKSRDTLADKIKRSRNDQMGGLLKEQISCMQKMLLIVQNERQHLNQNVVWILF